MKIERFNRLQFQNLPDYFGSGGYTGEFINEENLLTGAFKAKDKAVNLILECAGGNFGNLKLQGVEINRMEIEHPILGTREFITFCPSHEDFLDNVIIICNEIVELIEHGVEPSVATYRILQKWEYFLSKPRIGKLNGEQIIGLFGELTVINWMLDNGKNQHTLIDKWLGPLKRPRDFEFSNYWIEVKSTKRLDNQVEIHGIDQLEANFDIDLYLWVNQLTKNQDEKSLVELINEIDLKIADAVVALDYRGKLHQYGYHAADSHLYNEDRYEITKVSVYHVDQDFPKITRSMIDLPSRIVTLNYSIDLNGILEKDIQLVFNHEL
jgi:hypothetical protein